MSLWLLSLALGSDCENFSDLVQEARESIIQGDPEVARSLLGRAETGPTCSTANARSVNAFWLADGVSSQMLNPDGEEGLASLAAAVEWDPVYGVNYEQLWRDAQPEIDRSNATISLSRDDGHDAFLDGYRTELPAVVEPGRHFLQVRQGREGLAVGRVFDLGEGQESVVDLRPPEPEHAGPRLRLSPWLVGSGVALGLSGVTALGAVGQTAAMRNAETVERVEGAYRTQVVLGTSSYVLLGTAVTGGVLHVVL